jgi:hypothetical protein
MVVFASNKDRRNPGVPLHTNFRLASTEYLALVAPDGIAIATAFSPAYPPQVADASYGVPRSPSLAPLIAVGASCRNTVPGDGSLTRHGSCPGPTTLPGRWAQARSDSVANSLILGEQRRSRDAGDKQQRVCPASVRGNQP